MSLNSVSGMALPRPFLLARRAWLHALPAFVGARTGRYDSPVYAIEQELDHMTSAIRTHVADLMSRRRWNSRRFATETLAHLDRINEYAADRRTAVPTELAEYMALTRRLLEELRDLPVKADDAESDPNPTTRLVRICEALVAGDLSTLEAAAIIARLRIDIDPGQYDQDLLAFAAIDSTEDHLMVVDTERGWHPDVSAAQQRERDAAEAFHRPRAIDAARNLIERYRSSSA